MRENVMCHVTMVMALKRLWERKNYKFRCQRFHIKGRPTISVANDYYQAKNPCPFLTDFCFIAAVLLRISICMVTLFSNNQEHE